MNGWEGRAEGLCRQSMRLLVQEEACRCIREYECNTNSRQNSLSMQSNRVLGEAVIHCKHDGDESDCDAGKGKHSGVPVER